MYSLCIDNISVVRAPTMFKKTFPMSWQSIDNDGYAEKQYYPILEIIIYYT